MTKKIIPFEINLKSSQRAGFTFQPRPQILTNDANAAELNFIITDASSAELAGSTATVLLFMKDGSFFQNTDVTRVNNTFVYTIKPNQAKHKGVAQAQLVIKIGTVENASQLVEFEIVGGLETKPIVEREIQDWTSLTAEAKAFVEQIEDFTLAEFVENKMGQELANLEVNYATRLTGLESADQNLTAQLEQIAVNATQFGLSETNTWQQNRDALQSANDYVKSKGGGTVLVPSGECLAKGIIQDSHVTIDIKGKLIHPDGLAPNLISSRVTQTTGSIATGSNKLTVANTDGIEKGTLIGIRGARGISPLQNTKITTAIDATQTTGITLTSIAGFPTFGQFLVIGSEIINFTGLSGNTLTGVTRGLFGTTPSIHATGAVIGTAMRLVGEVVAIDGNVITIDRNAILGVTNSTTSFGVVHPKIYGNLKGNKDKTGYKDITAVRWDMVRFGEARYTAENFDSAMFLTRNSSDNQIDLKTIDCSTKAQSIGAAVWLFQGAFRNRVNLNGSGDMWVGLYIDNRTSIGGEWDETVDDNYGDIVIKSEGYTPSITTTGLLAVGANGNRFNINTKQIHTGFSLKNADQVYTHDGSLPTTRNNVINFNVEQGYQPHVVYAPGNIISGFHNTQTNGHFYEGNIKLGVSDGAGNNPVAMRFSDGSYLRPSISFDSEITTGFYKIAKGQVQFVSEAELIVRFVKTGLMFADGKGFTMGANIGSKFGMSPNEKIGFWGQTPVKRPTGAPGNASDLTSALELLNYIRVQLITTGLIES